MRRGTILASGLLVACAWIAPAAQAQTGEVEFKIVTVAAEEAVVTEGDDLLAAAAPLPKIPNKPAPAAKAPAPNVDLPPAAKAEAPPEVAPPRESEAPPPELMASMAGDRLAYAPNMFGDSYFSQNASLLVMSPRFGLLAGVPLPLANSDRVSKIAENGNTMPHDRVFFLYNHFNNALRLDVPDRPIGLTPLERSFDVDRYTVGVEKTFLDEWWSVELRMPFFGKTAWDSPELGFANDRVGNLAVILKRLILRSEDTAACIGLGIDTPTGGDTHSRVASATQTIHNDAVHLLPYVGLLRTPTDRFFYQGFLQVDVPTNGNRVDFSFLGFDESGVYSEQTLLYADLQAGYWLYRNRCARWLTGLAAVAELHYTTTLQEADVVSSNVIDASVTNAANHADLLHMTLGLHAELARHTFCRVAGVLPLCNGADRAFDGELQVQLERRF